MKIDTEFLAKMQQATKTLMSGDAAAATAAIQRALAGQAVDEPEPAAQGPSPAMRDLNPAPGYAQARGWTKAGRAAAADEAVPGAARRAASGAAPYASPGAAPHAAPGTANGAGSATPAGDAAADSAGASSGHADSPARAKLPRFAAELLEKLGVPANFEGMGADFKMPDLDLSKFDMPDFDLPGGVRPAPEITLPDGARYLGGSYGNQAGTRSYKLYIPSGYTGQPMPLVVMLHGCTQNPDDFAVGTQMNVVAEERQCLVVYPAQTQQANSSRCWNWFNAKDQRRDEGEPSIIAGIARKVMDEYAVDPAQVTVAGLSAGGAMAVIVGSLYPDLFSAVGVHSGLPFAVAKDLPSALQAMKGGGKGKGKRPGGGQPIIVFHGDKDATVHPVNGEQVFKQGLAGKDGSASRDKGSVPGGHHYTRTSHSHADGTPLGEHWVIHGAGHAWAGGSASGSYTDSRGPDASREMMRFFSTVAAGRKDQPQ
ncbi:extracellular catalytic domain type 1 short-chain-length polyhydroxyalkanoate depolymerase [Pseudoduganella namucuonensis]|uniref:Esterase, PHB depolymerase family n=1 Tax=Pseudoduganella namucuonensis TaxID=1035707 RepID=A0A1I7IAS4_9BURK|nr:PHB depolymerase family esterase [Pseudoduganella namucuonensis]SFU70049.1 esterase, PHB depolymerase family [Pseudoduganella namucuonensis]